jgi:hypothetical protein
MRSDEAGRQAREEGRKKKETTRIDRSIRKKEHKGPLAFSHAKFRGIFLHSRKNPGSGIHVSKLPLLSSLHYEYGTYRYYVLLLPAGWVEERTKPPKQNKTSPTRME